MKRDPDAQTELAADLVAAIEKLKRYSYRPVVLTDDECAALLAGQKADVKRIDFLIDLLNRSREYVPDNTWLAEQIESETAHNDGSSSLQNPGDGGVGDPGSLGDAAQ